MKEFKLAYRNLIGAGLRTWLNVGILSFILILIIVHKGFLDGWNRQAETDMIAWEIGGGQIWQENYDPYDPFTLEDSHAPIPGSMQAEIEKGNLAPVLITQGTIYPDGRMQSILLKGINPDQQVSELPTNILAGDYNEIPVIIGQVMARSAHLEEGDLVSLRWRDVNGTFDAAEVLIAGVFKADVPAVTAGQMWLPIDRLREMTQMPGEATILIADQEYTWYGSEEGWILKDHYFLLKEIREMIRMKSIGGSFLYIILMMLAMLAVFDTQVLSIFRRQKEIGTYMALGMTRSQVVRLFTIEGAMHSILAVVLGAIPGIPFLLWVSNKGFGMPIDSEGFGMAMAERIYPAYGLGMVITVMLLIIIITTIVSFLPSRKISKMNPTEAIKGKLQ